MTSTTVGGPAAGSSDPAAGPGMLARADGVTLIGELTGSGYREPPALVRRADGQTVQLTPLLYAVLEAVDGRRTAEEVAAEVTRTTDRQVTADNVATLAESQLRPLGLLTLADGTQPQVRKAAPLLGLRMKYVVTDPDVTNRVTAPFAALFAPVLVGLITLAFLVSAGWVLFEKGLAAATYQAFDRPGLLLLVFAVTVLSAGFHEFGHAAACRYGGATPGAMGAGLYLVWPAFYTDVTDSYRLGRAGRVRTDLGGFYFNAIFAVAMFGVWAATGFDAILLIIAAQVLQMVRQLTPIVRFDGYHVLADLTGVPDLYAHIKPTLAGLLPWNWRKPETKVLRPWARAVVSVWVLLVVPILIGSIALMAMALPRVAATAWASLGREVDVLGDAVADGDGVGIALRVLSVVAIALPVLATAYLLVRLTRRLAVGLWRWTDGRPVRRAVAVLTALAVAAALAFTWWPRPETYRPIQPTESGTVLSALGRDSRPAPRLVEGQTATARTLWADGVPPSKDEPTLAVVLVPSEGADAGPTWVFPFDRPDAPGPGDNQALAVNTQDGSTVYDVAFALVWADESTVLNRNEAYAFASCRDCRTVAVGFQVVLVLGQADVVVPQNLSGALNYNCRACVTYALAQQLVITLPNGLSAAARDSIEALWVQIAQFGADLRNVPLSQVQARLVEFERQILDIVAADAAGRPVPSPSASPTPTPTPSSTPSSEPTTTADAEQSAPSTTPTSGGGSSSPAASPTASSTATPTASASPSASTTP